MLVYDAGALVAADRQGRKIWTLHYTSLRGGSFPVVPTPALVQVYRDGARQVNLARLLKGCHELPLDGELAARGSGIGSEFRANGPALSGPGTVQ